MTRTTLFLTSLIGLAASAAVLLLLLPSMFDSGGSDGWLLGVLAVLVVAFGVGTRRWRPPTAVSGSK